MAALGSVGVGPDEAKPLAGCWELQLFAPLGRFQPQKKLQPSLISLNFVRPVTPDAGKAANRDTSERGVDEREHAPYLKRGRVGGSPCAPHGRIWGAARHRNPDEIGTFLRSPGAATSSSSWRSSCLVTRSTTAGRRGNSALFSSAVR